MENANRLQEKRVLRASQKYTGRENVCSDKIDTDTGYGGDFHFCHVFKDKNDYNNGLANFPSL